MVLLVAAQVGTAAAANLDVEPTNNALLGAQGPLAGGVEYVGAGTETGRFGGDWYYFYAGSQVQLTVKLVAPECDDGYGWGASGSLELLDADGRELGNTSDFSSIGVTDNSVKYTTPTGGGLYYLQLLCGPSGSGSYSFSVEPSSGVLGGAPPVGPGVPTAEPNESARQAIGPLLEGVEYTGQISTSNDQDWFYVNVLGQTQLDIRSGAWDECTGTAVTLLSSSQRELASAYVAQNLLGHARYSTGAGANRYYIQAGCESAIYQFRVSSGGRLITDQCFTAYRAYITAKSKRKSAKRAYSRAKGANRKKAKKKFDRRNAAFKRAAKRKKASCGS